MALDRSDDSLLTPFVWGKGGKRKTQDEIDADKKLALLLMKSGSDYSPVQHWTQGGARVMQALAGVVRENRANNAALQNASLSAQNIAAMLGANQPQGPSVVPNTPPQQPASPFPNSPDSVRQPAPFAAPQAAQPDPFGVAPGSVKPEQPFQPPLQQTSNSMPAGSIAAEDLNEYQRALLNTIAGPESAGAYNVMYSPSARRYFQNFADHPRSPAVIARGPNAGRTSDAAGKYQFLSSTWDAYKNKLGLPDFSPQSQDRAAWALAVDDYRRRSGGRDLLADLQSGDPRLIASVGRNLSGTWTSLPGGIEQGIGQDAFVNAFMRNLGGNNRQQQSVAPQTISFAPMLPGGSDVPNETAPQPVVNPQTQVPPLFLGDSHAAALARFGNGQSMGVNGANIAQSVAQPTANTIPQGYNPLKPKEGDATKHPNYATLPNTLPQGFDPLNPIEGDATQNRYYTARPNVVPEGVDPLSPRQGDATQNRFYQVAALGPVAPPRVSPTDSQMQPQAESPQPLQLAQSPFSMDDVNAGSAMLARRPQMQPQPIMPPQQAPAAPPPPPPAAPQAPQRPQVDPRIIQSLTSPYSSPQERAIAMELIKPHITPSQQQFSPLPNGMVLRKDPRSGRAEVVNPYTQQIVTDPNQIPQGLRNTQYGVTPQFAKKNGRLGMYQLGNDGTLKFHELPDDVDLAPGFDKVDLGTHFELRDKKTGQVVDVIKKDIAGAKQEEVVGKDRGENITKLPKVLADSDSALDVINGILNDPNLDDALGIIGSRKPDWYDRNLPRVRARIGQLEGKNFLQAFNDLKGGGQITEIEGKKATEAMARLRPDMDPKDYRAALEELRDIVRAARQRAIDNAAGAKPQQQNTAPPTTTPQRIRIDQNGQIIQ